MFLSTLNIYIVAFLLINKEVWLIFRANASSLDFFRCYLYRFMLVTHNIKLLSSYYSLSKKN